MYDINLIMAMSDCTSYASGSGMGGTAGMYWYRYSYKYHTRMALSTLSHLGSSDEIKVARTAKAQIAKEVHLKACTV